MKYRPVNLQPLLDTSEIFYETFPDSLDILKKTNGYNLKRVEVVCLKKLITSLKAHGLSSSQLSDFYSGYTIPQISKEFDLLRFGENYNINIELKSSKDEQDIFKQLQQNKYYLGHLEQDTIFITYISSKNIFFELKHEVLIPISCHDVANYIVKQKIKKITDINDLFNIKDFLVCPISSNNYGFISGKYFLTPHQTELKRRITLSKPIEKFFKIIGNPGTGKTLLSYDIAKEFINNGKKVVIFHSGNLNIGHKNLISQNGWDIRPAKYVDNFISENKHVDLIIIDEAQRIFIQQFKKIDEFVSRNSGVKLILSYDPKQTLSKQEQSTSLIRLVKEKNTILDKYTPILLSKKIRSNPSIGNFVQGLFYLPHMNNAKDFENISVEYYSKLEDCKDYINNIYTLNKNNKEIWTSFNYTTSSFNYEVSLEELQLPQRQNAHAIIGQEFENVIAIIGRNFTYNETKHLIYTARTHYDPEKMLYQMVTRAINKLKIIIVGNPQLYHDLLYAMSQVH